jgi:hypothetical protein
MSRLVSLARFLPEAAVATGAAARFASAAGVAAYKLPELPYAYGALEPVISGAIMELHHSKHHAAYVANLNKALEEYADAETKRDLPKMIALQGAINFNGGGARGAGRRRAELGRRGAGARRRGRRARHAGLPQPLRAARARAPRPAAPRRGLRGWRSSRVGRGSRMQGGARSAPAAAPLAAAPPSPQAT